MPSFPDQPAVRTLAERQDFRDLVRQGLTAAAIARYLSLPCGEATVRRAARAVREGRYPTPTLQRTPTAGTTTTTEPIPFTIEPSTEWVMTPTLEREQYDALREVAEEGGSFIDKLVRRFTTKRRKSNAETAAIRTDRLAGINRDYEALVAATGVSAKEAGDALRSVAPRKIELTIGGPQWTPEPKASKKAPAIVTTSVPTVTPSPIGTERHPTPHAPAGRLQRWVVLPDIHVPFHDVELLEKVCRFMVDHKPDGLVVGGDFLDLYSLSRYAADSLYQLRDVSLSTEYQEGRRILTQIESALPKGCDKYYIWGNHEDRYWREVEKGDRGKYGDALQSPTVALRLHESSWTVREHWRDGHVRLGEHLEVIHGLYCPVHSAKKHLDEWQGSVMFGHSHRSQVHYSGKRAAFNIGWLGDRDSKGFAYMPRTKRMQWTNGFAVVDIDDHGDYWAQVITAHNKRFVAGGRMY